MSALRERHEPPRIRPNAGSRNNDRRRHPTVSFKGRTPLTHWRKRLLLSRCGEPRGAPRTDERQSRGTGDPASALHLAGRGRTDREASPPRAAARNARARRIPTGVAPGGARLSQSPANAGDADNSKVVLDDDPSAGSPTETLLRLLPGSSRTDQTGSRRRRSARAPTSRQSPAFSKRLSSGQRRAVCTRGRDVVSAS